MAWPKKQTRTITVDNITYLWHFSGRCPCCSNDALTIGLAGEPYVLFIDPFPWNFEIKPSSIATAIQWAVENGWTPEKGPTKGMALDDQTRTFIWLPEGDRHLNCKDKGMEPCKK